MSYPFAPGASLPTLNISYRTVPLSFYSDLRQQADLPFEHRMTSKITKVTLDNNDDLRLLHLAQLMPLSAPGRTGFDSFGRPIRKPFNDVFMNWDVAGLLALVHFNERNTSVLPELTEVLSTCNVFLTMDLLDTQQSPIVASDQYYKVAIRNNTLASPQPGGVIGSIFTQETQPLAVLTGAYQIPQISPASSSSTLEFNDDAPLFARTVPSNAAHAAATVELLQYWNISHVACLFLQNGYGTAFAKEFQHLTDEKKINVISTGYNLDDEASLGKAVRLIKESGVRYIFGISNPDIIHTLLIASYDAGLVGNDYVWILPQLETSYVLKRTDENVKLVNALQGSAILEIVVTPQVPFLLAMSDLATDVDLRQFYVDSHPESFIFDDFLWNKSIPIVTKFSYTAYDAVMAMGIAACQAEDEFFSGQQHFDALKKVTFKGVSGDVAFLDTGTRRYDGLKYVFSNIMLNQAISTNETIALTSTESITIDFASVHHVKELVPFVFYDGTTTVPQALPKYEESLNLIGKDVRIFGWVLASFVILMAIGFGIFTYKYRNKNLVRSSQPIFLGMMCTGCVILASTVIPMSMQEPLSQDSLDSWCMSIPWLASIGFSTAFSAIFTKTYRIQKLFHQSHGMQRATLRARDVVWISGVFLLVNVLMLSIWTVVGPLEWHRVELENRDQYGRSVESYGACRSSNKSTIGFLAVLVIFNFSTVAFATYQVYISRHIPSDYNESYYIALTMASLMELFLIGLPILFLVSDNPAADFVVKSILVCFCCCSILLPLFVSKLRVGKSTRVNKDEMQLAWGTYISATERVQQSSTPSQNDGQSQGAQSRSLRRQSRESIDTDYRRSNGTVAEIRANVERKQRELRQQMSSADFSDDGSVEATTRRRRRSSTSDTRKRGSVSSKESHGSSSSARRRPSDDYHSRSNSFDETDVPQRRRISNKASARMRTPVGSSPLRNSFTKSIESFQSSFNFLPGDEYEMDLKAEIQHGGQSNHSSNRRYIRGDDSHTLFADSDHDARIIRWEGDVTMNRSDQADLLTPAIEEASWEFST